MNYVRAPLYAIKWLREGSHDVITEVLNIILIKLEFN